MQKTIGEYFVRPARRDAQAAAPAPGGAGPAPSARAGAGGALEKVAPSSSSAGAEGHQGWQTPLSASSAAAFAGRSRANKRGGGGLRLIPPPSLPRAQAAAHSAQGQGGANDLVSGENRIFVERVTHCLAAYVFAVILPGLLLFGARDGVYRDRIPRDALLESARDRVCILLGESHPVWRRRFVGLAPLLLLLAPERERSGVYFAG